MPMTSLDYPILSRFLCAVESSTGMPVNPLEPPTTTEAVSLQHLQQQQQNGNADNAAAAASDQKLPKGVVLGPDGKPCRTCTSVASWAALTKRYNKEKASASSTLSTSASTSTSTSASTANSSLATPASDCPPDVEALGRSSWTLLHSITANYPRQPSAELQRETAQFMRTFGKLYPCWTCAEDFSRWLREDGNAPRVSSRDEFGRWMCEAHNAVNTKLGKEKFNCDRWEERWRTGWKDGRCD